MSSGVSNLFVWFWLLCCVCSRYFVVFCLYVLYLLYLFVFCCILVYFVFAFCCLYFVVFYIFFILENVVFVYVVLAVLRNLGEISNAGLRVARMSTIKKEGVCFFFVILLCYLLLCAGKMCGCLCNKYWLIFDMVGIYSNNSVHGGSLDNVNKTVWKKGTIWYISFLWSAHYIGRRYFWDGIHWGLVCLCGHLFFG